MNNFKKTYDSTISIKKKLTLSKIIKNNSINGNNDKKFCPIFSPKLSSKFEPPSTIMSYKTNLLNSYSTKNIHSFSTSGFTKDLNLSSSPPHTGKILFKKNKINFVDRGVIKKTASFYIPNSKSLSSFIGVNPQKKMNLRHQEHTKTDKALEKLKEKTLYDLLPKKLKNIVYFNNSPKHEHPLGKIFDFSPKTPIKEKRIIMKNMSLLIKKPNNNNYLKNLLSVKRNYNNTKLNFLVKLKTIRWLWKNKKLLIEKFFLCYPNNKWFLDKNITISKEKFAEFILVAGLGKDQEFVDQIFFIFSPQNENKKEKIIINECLYYLMLTSNFSYERKINFFLDIINDTKQNKGAKPETFLNLLHLIIVNPREYNFCCNLFKNSGFIIEEYYDKNKILQLLLKNQTFKKIIDHCFEAYIKVDKELDDELLSLFNVNMRAHHSSSSPTSSSYSAYLCKKLEKIVEIELTSAREKHNNNIRIKLLNKSSDVSDINKPDIQKEGDESHDSNNKEKK